MNKRLQQRTDESDNLWWDAFATEFFEDDASITLTFVLEDGPKRHSKSPILVIYLISLTENIKQLCYAFKFSSYKC